MGKMDGILLCTDLDGTLLGRDGRVSPENLCAIEYFKKEGGFFTFITGRVPVIAREFYEAAHPNLPVGALNGASLYDYAAETTLWSCPLPPEALVMLGDAAERFPEVAFQMVAFERVHICRENAWMAGYRKSKGVTTPTEDYRTVTDPLGKIMFVEMEEDRMAALIDYLTHHPLADRVRLVRSERALFEVLPRGISKATALENLCRMFSLDPQKTVAVGDYDNDIEMLGAARLGIAVANASPAARAAADLVTVANTEHAIARIIEALDAGEYSTLI